MHTLIIEDQFFNIKAYSEEYPEICGYGATKEEAVGRMVLSSISAFGIVPGKEDYLGEYECKKINHIERGQTNCVIGTDKDHKCQYAITMSTDQQCGYWRLDNER